MLATHDEYPIQHDWDGKQGCRSLQFYCGGGSFDTLTEAIRHQASLEGKPRAPISIPKKKRR
jgi:hypothetical protein